MTTFSEIVDKLTQRSALALRKAQREEAMLGNIIGSAHKEASSLGGSVEFLEDDANVVLVRFPMATNQREIGIAPVVHWDGQGYELEAGAFRSDRFTSVEDGVRLFFAALDDVLQS